MRDPGDNVAECECGSPATPPMLDLDRTTTLDHYEPNDMHLWPGGDPNAAGAAKRLQCLAIPALAAGTATVAGCDSAGGSDDEADTVDALPQAPSCPDLCRLVTID